MFERDFYLTGPLSRTRLHSFSFDYSAGFGRAEKIEENLRGLGILSLRHQKSMDDGWLAPTVLTLLNVTID
jgi:hypothetical protein